MYRNVIKSLCFLLLFVILFAQFMHIFQFKYGDGIYPLTQLYKEQEDSADVMCFGSSHVFENVNTGILWEEYGIADFNLCGSIQPMWNTYYYMKEALKTQHPKVMVLDVFGAIQTEDYIDHSRIIKNNFGLKFSRDKIASVKVSSPEDTWTDYLLEYPTYHSRYTEINRADFTGYLGNKANYQYYKGFGMNQNTQSQSEPANIDTIETAPLTEKAEQYLNKIIALAKENHIPLVLVKSPYSGITAEHQKKYNRVSEIAADAGVPFLNFNLLYRELGLDFETDFADTSHLNHQGNVKYTRYLAEYLKENYEIPDRRGDESYQSYEAMAAIHSQQYYNAQLKDIKDIGNYIDKAQNKRYTTVYTLSGAYDTMTNYDAVRAKLMTIGINLDDAYGTYVWIIQNGELIYQASGAEAFTWHQELGEDHNLMATALGVPEEKIEVNLDNTVYEPVNKGLSMLIYDNQTQTLVESAGFPLNGNTLSYTKTNIQDLDSN